MTDRKKDIENCTMSVNVNMTFLEAPWIRCPVCGASKVKYNAAMILTSLPPKYECHCESCGTIFYDTLGVRSTNTVEKPSNTPSTVGWVCPRCGKVNAPHRDFCDCLLDNKVYCKPSIQTPFCSEIDGEKCLIDKKQTTCESYETSISFSENRCVFCDEIIPEGIQICPSCKKTLKSSD